MNISEIKSEIEGLAVDGVGRVEWAVIDEINRWADEDGFESAGSATDEGIIWECYAAILSVMESYGININEMYYLESDLIRYTAQMVIEETITGRGGAIALILDAREVLDARQ